MACDQYKKLSQEERNKKREYSKLDIGICLKKIQLQKDNIDKIYLKTTNKNQRIYDRIPKMVLKKSI